MQKFIFNTLFCFVPIIIYGQDKAPQNLSIGFNTHQLYIKEPFETNPAAFGFSIQYARKFNTASKLYWGGRLSSLLSYNYEPLKEPDDIDNWRNISIFEFAPILNWEVFKNNTNKWRGTVNLSLIPAVRLRNHAAVEAVVFQGALINGVPGPTTEILYYREFHEQVIDFGINLEIESRLYLNPKFDIGLSAGRGIYTNRVKTMFNSRLALYYNL
jgi:hypothetical protein